MADNPPAFTSERKRRSFLRVPEGRRIVSSLSSVVVGMRDQILCFGPFKLVPSKRLLRDSNRPLHVGNRAPTILQIPTERPGEVVEKGELARLVWPSTFVDETNIRVHIAALRRALGDGQKGIRYIINEPGPGHTFSAPVLRFEEVPHRDNAHDTHRSPTLPNFHDPLQPATDRSVHFSERSGRSKLCLRKRVRGRNLNEASIAA